MEAIKRLSHWRNQPAEKWLGDANRYLPAMVTAVLVVAIAYQIALLTWRALPGGTDLGVNPTAFARVSSPAAESAAADFAALKDSHLFGFAPPDAPAPVAEAAVDAPDTTLSLRLTGILFGEGGIPSQAIIAGARSQEKTYRTGQTIDDANGASLHAVYGDRVILNRAGTLETLRQPRDPSGGPATARAAPPRPAAQPAPVDSGSLRQAISQNASRLTDILRVTPHIDQGRVVGFRLNPGRDREAFEALGLQPGDVVTDINGTVLDDPSRGLQVFEALGEATMANVTVLRNGVPQLIVIDTSQLQGLDEENP